jgi:hypothetical protein
MKQQNADLQQENVLLKQANAAQDARLNSLEENWAVNRV